VEEGQGCADPTPFIEMRAWLSNSSLAVLARIIKCANLLQFPTDNQAQIHNMIDTVHRLHIENGRDAIAIDYVLLYFYALDERKDAGEESHDRLTASQFRHLWPFKRYVGRERHRR
jgi:hypothetical protein